MTEIETAQAPLIETVTQLTAKLAQLRKQCGELAKRAQDAADNFNSGVMKEISNDLQSIAKAE